MPTDLHDFVARAPAALKGAAALLAPAVLPAGPALSAPAGLVAGAARLARTGLLARAALLARIGPILLGFVILLADAWPAGAGAWTQPEGSYYLKLEGARAGADTEFDSRAREAPYSVDSLKVRTAEYRNAQLRAYVEYGVLDRLTGIASLSYQRIEVEEPAALHRSYGISDLRIGARYRLSAAAPVLAVAAEAKIPMAYRQNAFPALGSHAADLALVALAGSSFPGGYMTAEAGLNLRSGELSNEIPFSLEVGLNALHRTQVRAVLRGRRSLGSIEAAGLTDPMRIDARSLDLAGTLVYAARKNLDVEASLTRTVSGRNTLQRTEVALGLAVHR